MQAAGISIEKELSKFENGLWDGLLRSLRPLNKDTYEGLVQLDLVICCLVRALQIVASTGLPF